MYKYGNVEKKKKKKKVRNEGTRLYSLQTRMSSGWGEMGIAASCGLGNQDPRRSQDQARLSDHS